MCMDRACKVQMSTTDPLKLELQRIVSWDVSARNKTWVLWQSNKWAISPTLREMYLKFYMEMLYHAWKYTTGSFP